MNDYKKLIEELRDFSNQIELDNQRYDIPYGIHHEETLDKAADAIEQLVKERDAAIADLKEYASCDYCKHSNVECKEYWNIGERGLHGLWGGEKFEWRGATDDD